MSCSFFNFSLLSTNWNFKLLTVFSVFSILLVHDMNVTFARKCMCKSTISFLITFRC